ncbi:MAG: HEAT repeat domain-containing protein [Planctomycetota bacterium]|jgi:HEAT repeat protein
MNLERRPTSGREKDEESVELLEKLRTKLYYDNISVARRAAYNLSWMQEDGFEILKDALYSNTGRVTKTAASYGLRNMRGRMKKLAIECLKEGLEHHSKRVRDACEHAVGLLGRKKTKTYKPQKPRRKPRFRIQDIPSGNVRNPRVRNTYR